jgi:hypothetical protein
MKLAVRGGDRGKEVAIGFVDNERNLVLDGEVGELCARGRRGRDGSALRRR